MYPRWFNFAVLALWLTSMGWLVTRKVMPSFLVGQPPSYSTILAAQREDRPVGWTIDWNGRQLGWAVTLTQGLPQGVTEVRSLVHFDELPIEEFIPDWLWAMLPPIDRERLRVPVESESSLVFDPLGRLSRFESSVRLDVEQPFVKMRGTVDGAKMTLWVRVGDLPPFDAEVPVPRDALLGDALSPQSRLPGLRERQSWTVESYSPLRPPNSPKELLYASVESRLPFFWNGRKLDTFLVVYRTDAAEAVGGAGGVRAKLWVQPDGMVMKQQMVFFRSSLTFLRMKERDAAPLAARMVSEAERPEQPFEGRGKRENPRRAP